MRGSLAYAFVVTIIATATATAGCTGGDPPGPPPAELIGTWRYLPKLSLGDVPVADRQVVVFAADATYEIRSTSGAVSGEFDVEGVDLTIDPGGGAWITTNYYVTADRLIVDAMYPVGAVDGTVGVWQGVQSAAAGASTVTLRFDDDGAAQIEQTGPGAEVLDGTWRHVGDDVVFDYLSGSGRPFAKHYQEVPGAAVGEWMYERIPSPE